MLRAQGFKRLEKIKKNRKILLSYITLLKRVVPIYFYSKYDVLAINFNYVTRNQIFLQLAR